MKNTLLLLSFVLMGIFAFGQAPQGISYQTVVRDGEGQPLANTGLTLKMTIRAGAPDGEVVYTETHAVVSNTLGLVNLVIGQGTPQTGEFSTINWGNASHFLEIAIDLTGSGQFQVLGVTQFLSVPYAKYADNSGFSTIADGIQTMTEQERDALENPQPGMQIYNSTSNCLNYFNGTAWFETCGQCTPLPTQASAGDDQYFADATLTTTMQGNIPEHGTGTWTIESGTGGSFANANDPQTFFTGQQCESYSLIWTISTACGSTSDTVSVTFFLTPTIANAGEDQSSVQATWTTLAANTPLIGQGQWTILEGTGGQLVTPNSPNSIFLGQNNSLYLLEWKISSICTNSTDSVQIIFGCAPQPTIANAGPDQLSVVGTSTTLQGNNPVYGTGQWNIISGVGGNIENPENPTSTFNGQFEVTYELQWTISNACGTTNDNVSIGFISCGLNFTDTRDGQVYPTVLIGTQCWMAKNLNIGTRIAGSSNATNNQTIEKYCYNDSDAQCSVYGGLYQWNEMMNYTTTAGMQGICPEGWHLPTDAEWTALTNYVISQPEYLCYNNTSYIAKALAATTNWIFYNGTCNVGFILSANNATGFTALPGGHHNTDGLFNNVGYFGDWWASSQYDATNAWYRSLYYNNAQVHRSNLSKSIGFSVRCLKDN